MVAGIAVFGIVDGSLWRGLLPPTLAYRPAILFGLMLVFGWRGFARSQLLFFISFVTFLGWRRGVFVTLLYLISNACAFVCPATREEQPWLLRERSTLAFLAGAVLAPAVPALMSSTILHVIGMPLRAGVLSMVDSHSRRRRSWLWRQQPWYTFQAVKGLDELRDTELHGSQQSLPEMFCGWLSKWWCGQLLG